MFVSEDTNIYIFGAKCNDVWLTKESVKRYHRDSVFFYICKMSLATFCRDLKVFSAEDNYSSPASVSLLKSEPYRGRITWSGDGQWLAVAPLTEVGGPLPVFRYANKLLQPLKYVTLSNIVSASFFNWTNRKLAVGNENGQIFIWDLKEKRVAVKFEFQEKLTVDFVTVNSDDYCVASGSMFSNKVYLHGLKTKALLNVMYVPGSRSTSSLKFCMTKKNFLGACSIQSTVCVWDIFRSETVFEALNAHTSPCTDISFSPINFEVIASVSRAKTLKMHDLRVGKMVFNANVGEPMQCVDIIFNGEKAAVGTAGGSVIIYDLRAHKVFHSFKADKGTIFSVKTPNLKVPKAYQEVEMNTPDTFENPSKTLDISVIDILSPISAGEREISSDQFSQSKTHSFHSTPKMILKRPESLCTHEDSFLRKVVSPKSHSLLSASQSSPRLSTINEQPEEQQAGAVALNVREKLEGSQGVSINPWGDGFHADDASQQNLYFADIVNEVRNGQKEVLHEMSLVRKEVSEIRNGQREVLQEFSLVKKEMSDIKIGFENKFKLLQLYHEDLRLFMMEEIKQQVYDLNCDSKIEHISQRILMSELNKSITSNIEKVSEKMKRNDLKLNHIYELMKGN